MPTLNISRLPVIGWSTLRGPLACSMSAVIDLPNKVWTSSGKAAITFALREMRVGAGDRILAPTYHCPNIVAPIVATGAQPLFYPISSTGAPQLDHIASLDLAGVRGMIAAHYFGLPQPMRSIREFCDRHHLALIEDCAHAMFGHVDGQAVGTWGDYAIVSLAKFFPVLEGGCLVSSRHPLREAPTLARSIGDEVKNAFDMLETAIRFRSLPGINSGLAALFSLKNKLRHRDTITAQHPPAAAPQSPDVVREGLAAFEKNSPLWMQPLRGTRWLAQRSKRESVIALRRRNYQYLALKMTNIPGTRPLFPVLPEGAAPYVFPLLVNDPERYYQKVRLSGVPVYRWDRLWPGTPEQAGDTGAQWAQQVFQIGCHQDLDINTLDAMVSTLQELLASAHLSRQGADL